MHKKLLAICFIGLTNLFLNSLAINLPEPKNFNDTALCNARDLILKQEELLKKIENCTKSACPLRSLKKEFRNDFNKYANLKAVKAIEKALEELEQAESQIRQVEDSHTTSQTFCDHYRHVINDFKSSLLNAKNIIQEDPSFMANLQQYRSDKRQKMNLKANRKLQKMKTVIQHQEQEQRQRKESLLKLKKFLKQP